MKLPHALVALSLAAALAPAHAADLARAEEIVVGKCFVCHGLEGESSSPLFPRLAGQHARYVERQLADFKAGMRTSTTMRPMVADLTASDFEALGVYFETRPIHAHEVAEPELARLGRSIFVGGNPATGVAACAACHGPDGRGTETLPRLAGQHAQYTENQLRKFNLRERTNDNAVMQAIAGKLTEHELKAVASYLSGLK